MGQLFLKIDKSMDPLLYESYQNQTSVQLLKDMNSDYMFSECLRHVKKKNNITRMSMVWAMFNLIIKSVKMMDHLHTLLSSMSVLCPQMCATYIFCKAVSNLIDEFTALIYLNIFSV